MLESKLYAHLSTVAAVTTVIGTRLYPVVLPQDPDYPCVSYQRIDSVKINDLQGYSTLEDVRMQIDVWGTTYKGVRDFTSVIHTAMASATAYKSIMISDTDLSEMLEDGIIIYRISMDFSVWNRE